MEHADVIPGEAFCLEYGGAGDVVRRPFRPGSRGVVIVGLGEPPGDGACAQAACVHGANPIQQRLEASDIIGSAWACGEKRTPFEGIDHLLEDDGRGAPTDVVSSAT
jgi:hypothetical protein